MRRKTQTGNNFIGLKSENQIKFFVHYFLLNTSCCSAAAKGGTKKGKTVARVLNLIDPGGCACKTNKPLQSRTSDFETDQRVLAITLLYNNDASLSRDGIFKARQRGRQPADPVSIHPESEASSVDAASVPACCRIQTSFPLPFTLFVSPDSFFGKVLPFSWGLRGQQGPGSCCVCLAGRRAAFSVRVQLSAVAARGLQAVAQSVRCHLQLPWSRREWHSCLEGASGLKVGRKKMGFLEPDLHR